MADHLTEEQQVEALKKFWKENGLSIIAGIVFAIVVTFGWQYYKSYRNSISERASALYIHLDEQLSLKNQSNLADFLTQAKFLQAHYRGTPYASLATFSLVKQYVEQKKFNEAVTQLNWIVQHGSAKFFKQLARLRLARILLMQNQPEQALDVLSVVNSQAYLGLILDVRGDAYLQLKQKGKARTAFQGALKAIPPQSDVSSLIQMKLNNV